MLEKATKYLLPLFLILIAALILLKLTTLLFPVIFAYLLSFPLAGLTVRVHRVTRLPHGVTVFIVVVLIVALLLGAAALGIYRLVAQLSGFSTYLADLDQTVESIMESLPEGGLFDYLPRFYDSILSNVSKVTGWMLGTAIELVKGVPKLLILVLFFMLALFFFTKDAELVARRKSEMLERIGAGNFAHVQRAVWTTVKQYLKAQLLLMSITFGISFVVLMLYGVPYFPLIALGIALVDVMPLLGPAIVYVPWIIFTVISHNYKLAVLLAIAYLVTTLTRQVLEPKIVSANMGVHPLLTISTMCASYGLFGAKGLLIGIVLVMLVLISVRVVTVLRSEKSSG